MARRFDLEINRNFALEAYNFESLFGKSFDTKFDFAATFASNAIPLNLFPDNYFGSISTDSVTQVSVGDEDTFDAPPPVSTVFSGPFGAAFELSSLLAVNGGDGSSGFVVNGIDRGHFAGVSVSSAGDINGDGFDDILIGAGNGYPNGNSNGETFVVFGSNTGFAASFELSSLLSVNGGDGSSGFVINGIDEKDYGARSVSEAGDINGDGFDDIIIGAFGADPNGSKSGESYVVFGSNAGFGASLNLSSLNGNNGFVINGIDADDRSGESVSSAGDINGDGFDDILIGARSADPNGSSSGETYVIFGSNAGFAASLELSSLLVVNGGDGSIGFVINGIDDVDASGVSVSSAGDINGDGFDDIIIGASLADPNGVDRAGESYVVFGRDTGFSASLELSSLLAVNGGNGSVGFVINGIDVEDRSGFSVSSAGDINGDGFDDIIIGAEYADSNFSASGETYVVFGSNAGFGASLDLSSLDGSNGFVINGINTFDLSGGSVSSAGDINGDGFDDILIGAEGGDPNADNSGESYVIFGSNTGFAVSIDLSALDGSNGFVINGINRLDRSGRELSSAGDINSDGFDDIIVSAFSSNPNGTDSGQSYVIYGRANSAFELSSLLAANGGDGGAGFVINGIDAIDKSGTSVSFAGDVNGDGFDDFIIGAYGGDPNGDSGAGESYVVFGGAAPIASLDLSTLNGSNGFVINGIDANDRSGISVSSAGDINDDGFDDLIIGASLADPNGFSSGESYVIFGSAAPIASLDLSTINGTNGFVINGVDGNDRSGFSVSSAGDVNGDGVDDIIIGARFADNNGNSDAGESYVVFGDDTGFGASLDLSSLDGNNGFVINGIGGDDYSGISVASAGDVNGDGFDDVIIGAYGADANGNSSAGESYVVFGSAAPAASFDLSTLNGSNGFVINGIDADDYSGVAVSSVGDVNGDGFDDIIIGANFADPNGSGSGESYVVFGSNAGFAASLELSSLLAINGGEGSAGFIIHGIDIDDDSGFSVSSAGDINGDGFDDIIIGANGADPNGLNSGESYLIFGSAVQAASLDLSTLNGTNGFVINGIEANDRSGFSVSAAGDLNGDGFDDILIGASLADPNGSASGESYVIYGRASFGRTTQILSTTDDTYLAVGAGEVVYGLGGDDAITGTAGYDVLYGGAGDDSHEGGAGNDVIDGGDGMDVAYYAGLLSDYAIINNGDGTYTVTDNVTGNGVDTLTNIEIVRFDNGDFDIATMMPIAQFTEGDDVVNGTENDNILDALGGNDTVNGLGGNDSIFGRAGNDTLNGGNGDDIIDGGDGADSLIGGNGDDAIDGGDGADSLIGGEGADALSGGAGFDSADYRGATSGVRFNVDTGGTSGEALGDTFSSVERYYLSNFNDIIIGSDANEFFFGEGGNDTINAGGGIDRVYGGDGNDFQRGQEGNDVLYGSAGNDQLNGGAGFDIVSYELAASRVELNLASGGTLGDAAGDTYFGIEVVRGSDFNDTLTGDNSANELRGGDGDDILNGEGGNDRLFGGEGADSFDGGAGTDIVNYTLATTGVTLDLTTIGTAGEAAGDTFTSIEWVFGSDFDDHISGDEFNNRLEGRDGNDTLNGGNGNDRLLGGEGNDTINGDDGVDTIFGQEGDDTLSGGGGNDFFFGGAGADSHDGGSGIDTVSYLASSTGLTVNMSAIGTMSTGDAAGDSFTSIERIFGSGHDDNLIGNSENNTLLGNGGDDYLAGGGGNDSLNGGAGVDSFGYDEVVDGADVISGFTLNETIFIFGGTVTDFANLQALGSDAGANVIFDFGGGNTLTIVGLNLAELDASNFDFSGMPPAAAPLSDPDTFAADIIDVFDVDALI